MSNKITIEMLNEVRAQADLKPVNNISQRMINILHKEAADMVSIIGARIKLKGAMSNTKIECNESGVCG